MRETIGGFLAFVSLAAFAVSIVALIKPLPKLKLGTRGRAGLALIGSFILMGVAGSILPPAPETTTADKPAPVAAPAESEADQKARLSSETKMVWGQLLSAVEGCDNASTSTAEAFDRTQDVYALYDKVTNAQERCEDSWLRLNKLKPAPSAKGEAKKSMADALEGCSTAYWMKKQAYEKMAKVFNGDMRPSAVAEARSSMQDASGAQMMCVAGFMSAAEKAGVPVSELADSTPK